MRREAVDDCAGIAVDVVPLLDEEKGKGGPADNAVAVDDANGCSPCRVVEANVASRENPLQP